MEKGNAGRSRLRQDDGAKIPDPRNDAGEARTQGLTDRDQQTTAVDTDKPYNQVEQLQRQLAYNDMENRHQVEKLEAVIREQERELLWVYRRLAQQF